MSDDATPLAIKFQWFVGERPNVDMTGGEPTDEHGTIKLPGMAHGLEADPAPVELVARVKQFGPEFNRLARQMAGPSPVHVGVFIMDSDGHP